jgi:hypothetical protein
LILTGGSVAIDGHPLNAPVIPGLALTQNYSQLRHVTDGKVYWEGEYIFDCLAQPANTSDSQMRQWFFIPVPPQALAKAGAALHIRVSPTQPHDGLLFGTYPENRQHLSIPSPGLYSWEKAFYGVENDAGLTDPRLDQRFPIASSNKREPNIRLLVPDSPTAGTSSATAIAPAPPAKSGSTASDHAASAPSLPSSLATYSTASLAVDNTHPQQSFEIKRFPKYPAYALWMLRVTGQARTVSGTADPCLRISASSSDKQQTYTYASPWTLRTLPSGHDWTAFDMTIPFTPGRLPGHLNSLSVNLNLHTPAWKSHAVDTVSSASEIKDLRIEVLKLPQNPLTRFQLY